MLSFTFITFPSPSRKIFISYHEGACFPVTGVNNAQSLLRVIRSIEIDEFSILNRDGLECHFLSNGFLMSICRLNMSG